MQKANRQQILVEQMENAARQLDDVTKADPTAVRNQAVRDSIKKFLDILRSTDVKI